MTDKQIQRAIDNLELEGLEITGKTRKLIKFLEDVDTAISSMRELQQYQATGLTPHMVETLKENDKRSHQLAVRRATELDEYQEIGTLENLRKAMEKQIPMEVTDVLLTEYFCPSCGSENVCNDGPGLVGDQYCPSCGQKIYQVV